MPANDVITDYAKPLIVIEKLAKEAHNQCLKHDYKAARETVLQMGVEVRLLQSVLVIMEENQR